MKSMLGTMLTLFILQTSPVSETRTEVTTPLYTGGSLSLSPDGSNILFIAAKQAKNELWLYDVDSGTARLLPGTDDVSDPSPCWAPDGKSIAYFGANALKRFDLETGNNQVLVSVGQGRGCTWNREGVILFGVNIQRSIFRTTDHPGGGVQPATPLTTVVTTFPRFLPDGRHFLYFAASEGVYAAELGGGPPRHLLESDSAAVFSSTGYILFARQQTLYAQRFDPDKLIVTGDPIVVAKPVGMTIYDPEVSASANGHLIFNVGHGNADPQFTWFDRTGKAVGSVGKPVSLAGSPPELSGDGRWIVMDRAQDGNTDVWLMEVATGKLSQLTKPPGMNLYPVFSSDSGSLYFSSNRTGIFESYELPIEGPGKEKLVLNEALALQPRDISRDGRFLLGRLNKNIVAVQLDGNPRAKFPVVELSGPGQAEWPRFSPDNRWIVYSSTESGRTEVYIQRFPSGRRIKVSKEGGYWPRWQGNEVFYIAPNTQLIAVPVDIAADPEQASIGEPAALFTPQIVMRFSNASVGPPYVVSADGQRILVSATSRVSSPITVIRNWKP